MVYCGGSFVANPSEVHCFFDLGHEAGQSMFTSPDRIVWHAHDSYAEDWFPEVVRIYPGDPRTYRLFVRKFPTDDFIGVGQIRLASAGGYPGELTASFALVERLPRELWRQFTGFDGWTVVANHQTFDVAKSDVKAYDKIVKRGATHLELTRYEGDSLHVYSNRDRAWVMYLPNPSHTGLYVDPNRSEGEGEEVFRCKCGIDMEFPRSRTVEKAMGLEIARVFFLGEVLPDLVRWTDEVP